MKKKFRKPGHDGYHPTGQIPAKEEKWFDPEVTNTGWNKDDPPDRRRYLMLEAHNFNNLKTAKALQALANVTKDKETKAAAQSDADHFYKEYEYNQYLIDTIVRPHPKTRMKSDIHIMPPDLHITPREKPITPREKRMR